ncbi:insulinase family protein [Candidatus Dojkabacteria bacterium]|nr:insulinase family protein [Candidatus Dojkabacteria bacterium]
MKVSTKRLKNRLKMLTVTDKDSQSATVMVLVRVGSRFESDEYAGLAHFVEHTFFKGTKKRPTSKIIGMEIENLGGTSNAFTSQDYTGYFIKVPKEKFKHAIDILADIIKNSVFEEKEIDKERGVIIEEIRMYEDLPMRKAPELFDQKLYGKHPLGRFITGTIDTVSKMPRKAFQDFVNSYYVGENVMVVVAGGIEPGESEEQIGELFGELAAGKYAECEMYETRKVESELFIFNKEVEQTHLVLGGFGVSRKDKERFAAQVGNAILSEGFGSRLFQVIRDQLGLAYYVYSHIEMLDETGSYLVGLGVDNKRVEAAVEAVVKELGVLRSGNFGEDELERAKNYLVGNLVTGLETTDDMALWHGIQELLTEEVISIEEAKTKILSVTKEEVVNVWEKLLNKDNLLLVGISPRKDLNRLGDLLKL